MAVKQESTTIMVVPSEKSKKAVVKMLAAANVLPDWERESLGFAKRTGFTSLGFIVNTTEKRILKKMGNPVAGETIVSEHPREAAERAKTVFEKAGFSAKLIDYPEENISPENAVFLRTDAAPGWIFLFRKPFDQMGSASKRKPVK